MFTKLAHPNNIVGSRGPQAITYIVVHYTGNNGDTARNNLDYYAREALGIGAHFFVDETEACCSVPALKIVGHCGTRGKYRHPLCRNANSIGVEMCSRKDEKGRFMIPQATQENTAVLIQSLMNQYKIPLSHVIRHYDVTGKNCPAPMVEQRAWETFLALVEGKEGEEMIQYYESVKEMPVPYQPSVTKLIERGVLQGTGGGLHLSDDMCRIIVLNDRAGLYGR